LKEWVSHSFVFRGIYPVRKKPCPEGQVENTYIKRFKALDELSNGVNMEVIKNKVSKLARQVADELGVELFYIELLGRDKLLLRITINKESGVTLDDCERFSRSLEAILDVEDPIPVSYTLEVSSPGLDRPLREIKDFEKNTGKLSRIATSEKIENQNLFIGRIVNVGSDSVRLLVNEREVDIPFEKIAKARLEVEIKCRKSSSIS
jgi:ribosome maturation factor RimP